MAGSVNKVILVGNLGRDPEVRRLNNGEPVVNLSVATSETWRDKASGERKERTEWHKVVIFNENLAKIAEQYLRKGSTVYLEGQLQTRKYTDKDGVEKYTTEIRGESMVMLGGRQDGAGQQSAPASSAPPASGQRNSYADAKGKPQPQRQVGDDFDDDIPF